MLLIVRKLYSAINWNKYLIIFFQVRVENREQKVR